MNETFKEVAVPFVLSASANLGFNRTILKDPFNIKF